MIHVLILTLYKLTFFLFGLFFLMLSFLLIYFLTCLHPDVSVYFFQNRPVPFPGWRL